MPDHYHSGTEGDGGLITNVGAHNFLELDDAPSTYSGTENQYATSTGSGIEFQDLPEFSTTFLDLEDTPTTYSGGQYLRTTLSGIEAIDGIILEAPNGSEWLIKVTNSGILYTMEA
jgi:hypothetical protein